MRYSGLFGYARVKESISLYLMVSAVIMGFCLQITKLDQTEVQAASPPLVEVPTLTPESLFSYNRQISFEVTESDYDKKQKEVEAEKNRLAALKPKPVTRSVNGFAAGQCTAYVASKFPVTWRGDAGEWPQAAAAQGYVVNKSPVAGAALVTTENSYGSRGAGHVVYIDAVINEVIYVSEQNLIGWGKVSTRQIPKNSPLVLAVIHRR